MTRSLRNRIERLEDEYLPPVVEMEEIDCGLLVRRLACVLRLAANGDEEALAWRNKFFGNIKESSDESDEQDGS